MQCHTACPFTSQHARQPTHKPHPYIRRPKRAAMATHHLLWRSWGCGWLSWIRWSSCFDSTRAHNFTPSHTYTLPWVRVCVCAFFFLLSIGSCQLKPPPTTLKDIKSWCSLSHGKVGKMSKGNETKKALSRGAPSMARRRQQVEIIQIIIKHINK